MTSGATKKRQQSPESVEDLDAKIREMEEEHAAGYGEPLSWEQVTTTTAEELARKEQRRGILPRLIHAAKVRRLELEVARRKQEADEIRERLEPAYEAFQAKEEELRKAKEKRDAAQGEWAITLSAVNRADERTRRAEQELDEMRAVDR